MRCFIDLEDLSDQPSFTPPGHSGTLNHHLAHQGNGARRLAVWHGCLEPGGEAQEHRHPEAEQAFYVLAGEGISPYFVDTSKSTYNVSGGVAWQTSDEVSAESSSLRQWA